MCSLDLSTYFDFDEKNETTKKTPKKKKIKKEQDESLINGENHSNTEIEKKPRSFEKAEDAAMVV